MRWVVFPPFSYIAEIMISLKGTILVNLASWNLKRYLASQLRHPRVVVTLRVTRFVTRSVTTTKQPAGPLSFCTTSTYIQCRGEGRAVAASRSALPSVRYWLPSTSARPAATVRCHTPAAHDLAHTPQRSFQSCRGRCAADPCRHGELRPGV